MTTKRTTDRGFFGAPDGTRLYYENDQVATPRAAVLLLHGFGEHCGRYAELVGRLVERDISCFRVDYRGHGRAGGRRGHCHRFDDFLGDVTAFRQRAFTHTPGVPRLLVGHSFGGLLAVHSAAIDAAGLAGLALSSPFFGFGLKVPPAKALAGHVLSRVVPALSLPTGIDPAVVSHDPAVVAAYASDPLVGHTASARWFTETIAALALARKRAPAVRLPTLVQQAGDDRIASPEATRGLFALLGSPQKTYREYPDLFHEIWFELLRERPIADFEEWLEARIEDASDA